MLTSKRLNVSELNGITPKTVDFLRIKQNKTEYRRINRKEPDQIEAPEMGLESDFDG